MGYCDEAFEHYQACPLSRVRPHKSTLMGKEDAEANGAEGAGLPRITVNGEQPAKPVSEVSDLETAILDAASVSP